MKKIHLFQLAFFKPIFWLISGTRKSDFGQPIRHYGGDPLHTYKSTMQKAGIGHDEILTSHFTVIKKVQFLEKHRTVCLKLNYIN